MQENLNTERAASEEKKHQKNISCGRFAETPLQFVTLLKICISLLVLLLCNCGEMS